MRVNSEGDREMLNQAGIAGLGSAHVLYIDPGSGTFLIQLLVAALLGAGVAASNLWRKTLGRVFRLFRRQDNQMQEPHDKSS